MKLRERWGLGTAPIDSIIETVETKGGYVVGYFSPGVRFDGLSGRIGSRPVVVVNLDTAVDRIRYNVAHELGHLQLDCRGVTSQEEEKLAHRFAAALLVPADAARRELGQKRRHLSLEELGVLKLKYGLSMQAWIRRARDLEIIPENVYKTACIEFGRRGWRKMEPVIYGGHEKPTKLMQMAFRAIAEGVITPEHAERICRGSAEDPAGLLQRIQRIPRSQTELLRLPRAERAQILAQAAAKAEGEYWKNKNLTAFDAFREEDWYAEDSNTPSR
jgi:Zn-dependent peptidase ImmA (M78 family)